MGISTLLRGAALAAVGAMTVAGVAASQGALARLALPPPGIRVDVTPLAANAGEPTAEWVERELPAAVARSLAGRNLSGPLVLRIEYLTLGPNGGAGVHSDRSPDNISGVAIYGGREIPVRATTVYESSPIDQAMIEQSNHDRVSRLVEALAYWLPSEI
jgi:hypothetical protein